MRSSSSGGSSARRRAQAPSISLLAPSPFFNTFCQSLVDVSTVRRLRWVRGGAARPRLHQCVQRLGEVAEDARILLLDRGALLPQPRIELFDLPVERGDEPRLGDRDVAA